MKNDVLSRRHELIVEREELSRTVQALAERFDVAARARAAARSARSSSRHAWDRVLRSDLFLPAAAAVGALLTLAGVAGWRRRRR